MMWPIITVPPDILEDMETSLERNLKRGREGVGLLLGLYGKNGYINIYERHDLPSRDSRNNPLSYLKNALKSSWSWAQSILLSYWFYNFKIGTNGQVADVIYKTYGTASRTKDATFIYDRNGNSFYAFDKTRRPTIFLKR